MRQGDHGSLQAYSGPPGLLQGVLPTAEVCRGRRGVARNFVEWRPIVRASRSVECDALFLSGFVDAACPVRYDAGLFPNAAAAVAAARATGHGDTHGGPRCRSRNESSVM